MDLTSKLAKLAAGRCWDGYEPVPGKGAYTDDSCRKTGKKKKKREKSAKSPAWQRKSGKNSKGGLNEKGRKSYESENPGSDLKAPVTGKVKPGGKAAKRRKSFCARMSGNKGPMKKPNGEPTRKALSLRKWKCGSDNQPTNKDSVIMEDQLLTVLKEKLAASCGSHPAPKKKKKKKKKTAYKVAAHCHCDKKGCPKCDAKREKESSDLRLKLASHLIRRALADEKTAGAGMVGRSSAKVKALIESLKNFGKKTALPAAGAGAVGYGLGNYQGFGAGRASLNDLSIQDLIDQAMANKEASLKGDQHKLDANKNGKIEASDLKKLRGRGVTKKAVAAQLILEKVANDPYMTDMEKIAFVSAALKGLSGAARYGGRALLGAGNMGKYMGKGLQQGVTAGGNLSRTAQPGVVSRLAGRGMQGAGGLAQRTGQAMQGIRGPQLGGMEARLANRAYQAAAPRMAAAGKGLARGARVRSRALGRQVSRSPLGQAAGNTMNATRNFVRRNPLLAAGGAYAAGNYLGQNNSSPQDVVRDAYQSMPFVPQATGAMGDAADYASNVGGAFAGGLGQGAQNMYDGAQNVANYVGDAAGTAGYRTGEAIGDGLSAASNYFPGGPRR